MIYIKIKKEIYNQALGICSLDEEQITTSEVSPRPQKQEDTKSVCLNTCPNSFLEALCVLLPEKDKNKKILENFLTPSEKIFEKPVSSLKEVAALMRSIIGRGNVLGVKVGKLKFPVFVQNVTYSDNLLGSRTSVEFSFRYGDQDQYSWKNVLPDCVETSDGEISLKEVLEKTGFIPLSEEDYNLHKKEVEKTYKLQTEMNGKQVRVRGPVYVAPIYGNYPIEIQVGSSEMKAMVESDMELDGTMWYENTESQGEVIPMVRVFLLDMKDYCYVPVCNVLEHVYDTASFSKVVLPDNVRTLLEKIFLSNSDRNFGDIFGNRHGGTVVLADGPPGTGKTLTAEAVAELSQRPLYIADVGEIGVTSTT